ncbi:PREDICTED: potassium/sodium hyperpolarization-activated cyclic nucleotide-gated channel 2-like [Papilio xuthus]|uniref:Potassium/sodium hyperpolarization-activated cyclic nucleotide-gated channel 2-like n=1 Tax=Papilio xuthus TaxID=66420 RepID=A0AAJ6Z2K6_PAPXU|nr:PREDICTED: potassium/sodium hyperpolarization-activated cyclic nucleotide-gated channel 2-like [Papilio xuthus]
MFISRYSKVYEATEGEMKADASHSYFQGHKCCLPPDKISTYEIHCSRFRKFILNLISVHAGDVRAKNMFRSYAALCMERQRQFKHYPFSIHPYSRVRLWLEALFVVIMLLSNIGIAVLISRTEPNVHDYFSTAVKALDFFYIFNVFFNFFTGYIEGNTCQRVVLDLRKIARKYACTWLLVDVTSSLTCLDLFYETRNVVVCLVLGSLKILRMLTLYMYVKNLVTVLKIGILSRTLVESSLFILSYLTWNVYFQFMVEYMQEQCYTPVHPRNCSWLSIGKLWNQTSTTRFVYSFDRAVGMLRGNANLNLLKTEGCFENFFIVAWVIAKIIVLHCAFKYIIALFGSESARAKYFMMQQQIETYMNQRKYPSNIKKKIIKFYSLRFQSHFFVESRMMSCVSGQLREDLIMYSGRQLMRDVAFLKHIPRALLLEVGLRLQMVLFIAGDVIMKINTIGDCMFFIDKGTVAIYSESGREVCHLEDGDFFGDIALTMKHKLRTATAVAVTNCELFKLNKEDFDSTIACYPTVYEEIEKVAASRLERTQVLDEHHKAESKMLHNYENM